MVKTIFRHAALPLAERRGSSFRRLDAPVARPLPHPAGNRTQPRPHLRRPSPPWRPAGAPTSVVPPDPRRSLPVAPLIGDKRCYGEATARLRRGYGGIPDREPSRQPGAGGACLLSAEAPALPGAFPEGRTENRCPFQASFLAVGRPRPRLRRGEFRHTGRMPSPPPSRLGLGSAGTVLEVLEHV